MSDQEYIKMRKEYPALWQYAKKRKKEHAKAGKTDDFIASWERAFWKSNKKGEAK